MAGAQKAAARVVANIGALGCQLLRVDGHHVTIAGGEERLAAAGGGGRHLVFASGCTSGSTGADACGKTGGHRGGSLAGKTGGHRGGSGSRGGSGGRGGSTGGVAGQFPKKAVAAFLETGNHLPQREPLAAGADDGSLHHHQEMEMVGHDDIVLHLDHGIMSSDGGEQLVLYHLPYRREDDAWRIGMAIGSLGIARHPAQRAAHPLCHMHGDVVGAGAAVVVVLAAPGHGVLEGIAIHLHASIKGLSTTDGLARYGSGLA